MKRNADDKPRDLPRMSLRSARAALASGVSTKYFSETFPEYRFAHRVCIANNAERRPIGPPFVQSDDSWRSNRDHRDDPQCARLDDDDLVIDDEVSVAAPPRLDPDQRFRHRHDADTTRHHRADADVEVDPAALDPRCAARLDHGVADRGS